jgi:flagellum-specific peptidoglycan hydrolase FlgJ
MVKNTQTSIKLILWSTIVVAIIIGTAFVAGTFYPNYLTIDKLEDEIHKQELKVVESLGLTEPEYEFTDQTSFINATSQCVSYLNWTTDRNQRVPISIIIAMAGIESAWGTSRFATEGNALFGVRTWSLDTVPHMKAKGNPDASWGVKKYDTKCQSVKDMIRILNTHPAYELFRDVRAENLETGKWDYRRLLSGMTAWSTNPDYAEIILQTIVDNKLP